MKPVEHLFTYGLLMPGYRLHDSIAPYVRRARLGLINGILLDLGFCPALVPGEGVVCGMLLEIEPEALEITDHIEGCCADRDASFYSRRMVKVRLARGENVEAWVYELAHPNSTLTSRSLVSDDSQIHGIYAWS